ncbi:MAG TPA: hypothetical protein VLU43_07780 [Anaeromyxobacteraceae bacterium]|nr:hypothetical protein [Anaeromyxobacteraceae bacterium]
MSCRYAEHCPMFKTMSMAEASRVWQGLYCESTDGAERCKRLQAFASGTTPPDDMLPNGMILSQLVPLSA